ncbi:MAG: carboxymuconolactone decarboxylase family protein [Gemmatimonadaceae bacterium]
MSRGAPRGGAPVRNAAVPSAVPPADTVSALDAETRALVRLAAVIAASGEPALRTSMADAARTIRAEWVEELVLQSYLFAGFPRALNAAREWRRATGAPAPVSDEADELGRAGDDWAARGETTCRAVYGTAYERLRRNIRMLHPALDAWMITEGYGKVLSRPALDLARRELCVIAACAAGGQERQLHAHLHGAVNVGASAEWVSGTLDALAGAVAPAALDAARLLWARVRGK